MPKFIDIAQLGNRGEELVRLIEEDVESRDDAIKEIRFMRNLYYGMRARDYDHEGQGDIHLPILAEKIENLVAKEMNAFWAATPHAHAQRVPVEFDEQETAAIERKVNWAVETDIPDFYSTFESWIRNCHIEKVSVLKAWYNRKQRLAMVMEEADLFWLAGQPDLTGEIVPEKRPKLPIEVLASVFPQGLQVMPEPGFMSEDDTLVEQPLDGQQVLISFSEDHVDYHNVRVQFAQSRFNNKVDLHVFRPIDERDNVEVDLVDFEDIIVPFRAKNLQEAERVTQQYWITVNEVHNRIESGEWEMSEEDFKTLKTQGQGERHQDIPGKTDLKDQRDVASGQKKPQASTTGELRPYHDDKVLVFEVYARDMVPGTGYESEVIYQIPYGIRKIVQAQFLEEVFPHGRRPFAALHSVPIGNRWYGWSLAEFIAPINLEANVIVNSVNDAQELINNPWFFYMPTSIPGHTKVLKNIQPGDGIPVADINGVMIPQFTQQPLANLSALDSMLLFADRLTLSPQSSGSSQVRNSPRTARGTLALLSEAGIKIDSLIMAAQKSGWAELIYQIYALYEAFGSDDKWMAVTGRRKPQAISKKDLRGRVEFTFKGNSVNTNREVRRALAQLLYNTLVTNPLVLADMRALRAITENFIKAFQEGAPNIDPLIPAMPEGGSSRQPMDQKTEIQIMKMGMPVDVHPLDNDLQHITDLGTYRQSSDFENLTQVQVALMAAHEAQHQRALLAKQSQSVQMSGQANNVPIGGPDLGALEGGVQ